MKILTNKTDELVIICDTYNELLIGEPFGFIGRGDDAKEAAKRIINNAVDRNATVAGIIEEDGVRGLPAAEWAIRRMKWKGTSLSLVYGVQVTLCINESSDHAVSCKAVLIPRNHEGFRNICELLTLGYSKCPNADKPVIPYEEIEKNGNSLICLESKEKNNSFTEYGLKKILEYVSKEPLFVDRRYFPDIEGSEEEISRSCYRKAHSIYGEQLPERVELRLEKELASIINNGYSSIFSIVKMMTDKARTDGTPVGFVGAVGSSLVAFLLGITEINPLPPHYVCSNCSHYAEPENEFRYESGWELPKKKCQVCGAEMKREGYRIPCEVLFGAQMNREPDVDLVFPIGHALEILKVVSDYFGKERIVCFDTERYSEEIGMLPRGMFIIPEDKKVYDFTPVVKSTDEDEKTIVTQIDYHDVEFDLTLFDILEHEGLCHLKMLWELTGVDPKDIPLDDEDTICYIANCENGFPELKMDGKIYTNVFETEFGKQIISAVKPKSFSDLIRISALIYGTDTWEDNAKVLIGEGTGDIKAVISTRDDIMNYLLSLGMAEQKAAVIMECVRKGRELTGEMIAEMKEYGVPDWYIRSCKQLKYVFPRAHVVQYTMMCVRQLWYKIHYPEEYARAIGMQN